MKFGQNLEQYSVPQWAPYNLDYDNVKKLIKYATTKGTAQAIKIPGRGSDDQLAEGAEQDLYLALCEELDRVELYCKTKYGEIQRRLDHHTKLYDKLNTKSQKPTPKRLQRLSRLEEGIIKAGQDLQLLSRFIGANRLAFVKLLKKYKKWGGSMLLIQRFRSEKLDQSEFVAQQIDPFVKLLSQYTSLLETVRAPFDSKAKVSGASTDPNQVAHDLQIAFQYSIQADFDAVFGSATSSTKGGRAIYWIHQDNLIQAHVLLQSISNQRRPSTPNSFSSGAKNSTSPLNTFGNDWYGSGMIMCDREDVNRTEQVNKAYLYYTTSDKAVSLSLSGKRLSLRRKDVALLLQTDYTLPDDKEAKAFNTARSWFKSCQDVKPLMEAGYSRTRFAGFSNSNTQGIWATLDNDILMAKPGESLSSKAFPHAILDIRWEGMPTPDIVRNLDRKVIAERISNFNLTIHAMATIYPTKSEPEWFKLLQTELRRTSIVIESPTDSNPNSKHSSATTVSDRPLSPFSVAYDQSSATSTHEVSELMESVRKNKRNKLKRKLHLSTPREEEDVEAQPRYWNEFDDGDEGIQRPEPYSIEIYPDDEDIVLSMFSAFGRKIRIVTEKLGLRKTSPETRPLLSQMSSNSSIRSMDSPRRTTRPRTYSTFASYSVPQPKTPHAESSMLLREQILFFATCITFVLAIAFLIMSTAVESIGRKKYTTESRVFSVFGILMSFMMASLGLSCGYQKEILGVLGRVIVVTSFVIVCVADIVLMVVVSQSSA